MNIPYDLNEEELCYPDLGKNHASRNHTSKLTFINPGADGKIKVDPQRYRPVAYNGHPDINPESVAYQEYWEQERDRCINGFKPKGMKKISGKYYFYLNYYKILGNDGEAGSRKTLISPWYRQMDHEYFDLFELLYL